MVATPRRRLVAVLVAGLVPWTVLVIGGELTLVFTAGLVNTNPPNFVSITDFFFRYTAGLVNTNPPNFVSIPDFFFRYTAGLPQFIESWGAGVLLYALGVTSAVSGVLWREDPRVTALSLVGAALLQVGGFLGFDRRLGYTAIPMGTAVLLTVVWWYYWPLLRNDPTTT